MIRRLVPAASPVAVLVPVAVALAALTTAATAQGVDDLVGARAPGAEATLTARGYGNVGAGNTWWSAGERVCIRLHVSQGRVASITRIRPSACGADGGAPASCPPDLSQADLAEHPGCSL